MNSSVKQAILRKSARNRFVNHCEIVSDKYEADWFHEILCNVLQKAFIKVQKGESARIIIEVPPRHGKSETSTIHFPSWVLGQEPEWPIITSSYSADLSQDFGQATRDIMRSENYKLLYDVELREDTQAKGKWKTEKGGGYTAVGVGGPLTGKGFKIGIIDDPHKNRQDADSEVMRNNVWKWYTSTFYTRQEGVSAIIVIMTRWHIDDLVGRLLKQQEENEQAGLEHYDKWERIKFPAIATKDEKYRKKGEALWGKKFPLEVLENTKNNIGPMEWSALYQQNPLAGELMEFKEEYIRYFNEEDLPPKMHIDITVDPAISKKKDACNTSIIAVGKAYRNPNWYILDYKVGKFDPFELIDKTFNLVKETKELYPDATLHVRVEGVAYQESLKYYFREEMKKREFYFMLDTFTETTDKLQRIRGLVPLYKTGVIYHRRWMKEIEEELINFPQSKTIDIMDSLAAQLKFKMNTEKPIEEDKFTRLIDRMAKRNNTNNDYFEETFL